MTVRARVPRPNDKLDTAAILTWWPQYKERCEQAAPIILLRSDTEEMDHLREMTPRLRQAVRDLRATGKGLLWLSCYFNLEINRIKEALGDD